MTQEIIQSKNKLTADDMRAQVNLIQEVMQSVMKKDIHYGIIPGCKKPSLYKPGAEKILMTFCLVADNPVIEDLSTSDSVRYRVTQRIIDRRGVLIGAASGECSSDEDKYKWRRPVCDEEFEDFPIDRKMEKWTHYQGKTLKIKRVRTNPADVGNTILKMAVKRAVVAATLICTAASDVFDQDIEDLPEGMAIEHDSSVNMKPAVDMPVAKKQQVSKKEAFNVIEAMDQPVDSTINIWGVFFDYRVQQVGKDKKDITRYKLSPREGTQLITISKWGGLQEDLSLGDVIQFNGVVVKDFKGTKQYLGEEIVVLEKVKEETRGEENA